MVKQTSSLRFRFTIIFSIFTIISLLLTGITTYYSQTDTYKRQCEQNIRSIGEYLESMILNEAQDFVNHQKYYMEHFAEIDIPFDANEFQTAKHEYERLFHSRYVGKVLGEDIHFDELDPDIQKAYFIYRHLYWLITFENARTSFHIPYTYYLVPKEEIYNMVYMIDGERTAKAEDGTKTDTGKYMYLGDEYYDDPVLYNIMWDAWFSGKKPKGYQVWNNEWGHTYAYYTPLIINGTKMGLIGTEIEVNDVNTEILKDTFTQLMGIGICLIICIAIMLAVINKKYISKIASLQMYVKEYTLTKDSSIAEKIQKSAQYNRNEISNLAIQFAVMILKIEEYMKNLISTTKELSTTKEQAARMNELATKDSLTGIRNKTAYDGEVKKLEWKIEDGHAAFGIAMVDLNFLKRINDTYGHEQGNVAIKKLCMLICHTFEHSPVFRIGGDEFVIILETSDLKNLDKLVDDFSSKISELCNDENLEQWEKISAAIGYAVFNPEIDSSVENVFKRADKAMYARKKQMKAVRE